MGEHRTVQHSRTIDVAFWFLGLINNFTFVLFITAAEDILEGYAGLTLVCTVIPGFLCRLVFASFVHRIPYFLRIFVVSVSNTAFSLSAAYAQSLSLKLTLICLQAAFGALGEISFLALTSRFSDSVIGTWSSGTGAAGIAGAGAYVVLRSVIGLSSRATVAVCSPLSLLLVVIYQCFLANAAGFEALPSDDIELEEPSAVRENPPETTITKREYMWPLLTRYMLPLAIVYFAEYSINQGVLGTLTHYKNNKHYDVSKTYSGLQFTYQLAVFISRSSIQVIQIHRLWVLPVLQSINLVFLSFASALVLLPSAPFAYGIVFWEGLLGGLTYVNAFTKLRNETPAHLKEWALGVATVGDAAGISIAAVASIWLEQAILRFRGSA